jgi:hypothetical protein
LIFTALTLLAANALDRNQAGRATIFLTIAALPKLWTAPMLALLMCKPTLRRALLVVLGVGTILSILLLNHFLAPGYNESFIERAQRVSQVGRSPIGFIDGSLHNLIKTLGNAFDVNKSFVFVCWIVSVLLIVSQTVLSSIRLIKSDPDRLAHVVFLASLGLILIHPRVLFYQWTYVVPALAYLAPRIISRPLQIILVGLAVIPTLYINRYLFGIDLPQRVESVLAIPWGFSNLIAVFAFWVVAQRPTTLTSPRGR